MVVDQHQPDDGIGSHVGATAGRGPYENKKYTFSEASCEREKLPTCM
jgi:hypothetical protein